MLELIGETLIKKIIDAAGDAIEKKIDLGGAGSTSVDKGQSKIALFNHIDMIGRWATEISFRDLRKSKRLLDSFEDLELTLGPLSLRGQNYTSEHIKSTDLFGYKRNVIILGDPGAGKTTSLKRLALSALTSASTSKTKETPILIRLRDLGTASLLSEILGILGLRVNFDKELGKEDKDKVLLQIVGQYLTNLRALLMIDGLDEVPFRQREAIIRDLRDLMLHSKDYRVMVTSRTADFTYSFENSSVLSIEPLSQQQIQSFAAKWLGDEAGEDLLEQIHNTPYGGTEVLPLTLAHLCAIYERSGKIPEKPRTVYRKIVRLLLEEWDEQRSVRRESRYASFDIDRKEDFLKAIAFRLTVMSKNGSFNDKDLESAYRDIYDRFGLPKDEAEKVAREIESHSGLIVETWFDSYEFAHKSIQEYLCAEYILKLPSIPAELTLQLPNEIALAVALSSDSNEYFSAVVDSATSLSLGTLEDFTRPFLRRVLVERVDFRQTPALGHATLGLYSETYFPTKGQLRLPFEAGSDEFSAFLRSESVRGAVTSVLDACVISKGPGQVYLVTPARDDRPRLTPLLEVPNYYTVDDRLLALLNWELGKKH